MTLSVVLTDLRLRHPRSFGDCWLGCVLWDELGLSKFWDARLRSRRGKVPWRKVLQRDASRIAGLVKIREPKVGEPVNRETFVCTFDRPAWNKALDRDGCYILRAYLPPEDTPEALTWEKQAPVLWAWYTQLVHVEEAFKTLESDLDLRPIHHQIERRGSS